MTTFRFGIVAAQSANAAQWTGLARKVESNGYSSLLVPDTVHTLTPAVACAVAATATQSLRVGPYVLAAPNRTAGQVAIETATLDALTDGRFELGLGAGREGADRDAEVFGRPFGSPADRIAQVVATVAAVRDRSPRTRVLVAASGRRLLGVAARIADTVALGLPPQADETRLTDAVAQVRDAAGSRFDDLELCMNLLCVGENPPPWMAQHMKVGLSELVAGGSVSVLTGTTIAMADTLLRRRDKFGISYVCTNDAFVDDLARVVERLAGR